jgi:two-component system KDP operon response regulator KdpE
MTARILVVEDEEPLRRVLVRNLEERGYRVREASTAQGALESCNAAGPDVLVLDINLPDASGWDVLRGLTACGARRPRIVVISAAPARQSRLAEFSPLTFLQKPFPIDALLRAVERAVSEVGSHGPLDRASV